MKMDNKKRLATFSNFKTSIYSSRIFLYSSDTQDNVNTGISFAIM